MSFEFCTSDCAMRVAVALSHSSLTVNPNTFVVLVGKVRKNYLPKEEGREGGGKERAQLPRRARGSNPGPAAC